MSVDLSELFSVKIMIWSRLILGWWLEGSNNRSHIDLRRAGKKVWRATRLLHKLLHIVLRHPRHFYSVSRKNENLPLFVTMAVAVKGVEELTIHQRISSPQNRIILNLVVVKVKKYQKTLKNNISTQRKYKVPACIAATEKNAAQQKQFIISQR